MVTFPWLPSCANSTCIILHRISWLSYCYFEKRPANYYRRLPYSFYPDMRSNGNANYYRHSIGLSYLCLAWFWLPCIDFSAISLWQAAEIFIFTMIPLPHRFCFPCIIVIITLTRHDITCWTAIHFFFLNSNLPCMCRSTSIAANSTTSPLSTVVDLPCYFLAAHRAFCFGICPPLKIMWCSFC